jgi:ubiquinone/menaquinone biosynthesis C-methylase UbiE
MEPDDWRARQDASVRRYASEHYNEDPRPARMFGNFIGTTLTDRDSAVLDIGCGISPKLPLYVDELGLTNYVGLDPLDGPETRAYRWLKAMAEKLPFEAASIDAVLFATSFDHIANAAQAIEEARRVLKPGGRVYMWQGLYDPIMIARAKTFEPSMAYGFPLGPLFIASEGILVMKRMWKRRRDMAKGNRIDAVHERWFTRTGLMHAFDQWGFTILRWLEPPGLASAFVEASDSR